MSIILTVVIALAIIAVIFLFSITPLVGIFFDVVSELGSAPRFLYMGFAWSFSASYRNAIKQEHRSRNAVLAWCEYLLALICLVAWLVFIFYIAHQLAVNFD